MRLSPLSAPALHGNTGVTTRIDPKRRPVMTEKNRTAGGRRDATVRVALAIGAGMGMTAGVLVGGGPGIAIGATIGASLGVVFSAAWDARHPSI
jgi:hypothetical protein